MDFGDKYITRSFKLAHSLERPLRNSDHIVQRGRGQSNLCKQGGKVFTKEVAFGLSFEASSQSGDRKEYIAGRGDSMLNLSDKSV